MLDLSTALARQPEPSADPSRLRARCSLHEDWYQGAGAYGGLVAGQLAGVMLDHPKARGRQLRSFTAQFCAPAKAGPATLEARALRVGVHVSHLRAELLGAHGELFAIAQAAFGSARASGIAVPPGPGLPPLPPPDQLRSFPPGPAIPRYCQAFEYQLVGGSAPFSGSADPRYLGWIRLSEAGAGASGALDVPALLALLDAWPPAALAAARRPTPAATIDLTIHLLADLDALGLPARTPIAMELAAPSAGHGYAEELAVAWAPDGTVLARARQCVALLG